MSAERDVLVVDDEPMIGGAVSRVCAAEGLSCDVESRAEAGLERLRRSRYRLVLCDIMMAELDGFGFLAEMARLGAATPVVMITGYSTVDNAVRSLAAGAVDFLPKPFTADEVLSVVQRGLRAGRLPGAAPCPPPFHRLGRISWLEAGPEGSARIGAADPFLKTLGGVHAVELAAAGGEVVQGAPCATIVAGEGARHHLLCPVSGRIAEVNPRVARDPALLEQDPYGEGWLYRVVPADLGHDLARLTPCRPDPS